MMIPANVLCAVLLVRLVVRVLMTVSAVSQERILMETFVEILVVIYTHKTTFVLPCVVKVTS